MNTKMLSTSDRKAAKRLSRSSFYQGLQKRQSSERGQLQAKLTRIADACEKNPGEPLSKLKELTPTPAKNATGEA